MTWLYLHSYQPTVLIDTKICSSIEGVVCFANNFIKNPLTPYTKGYLTVYLSLYIPYKLAHIRVKSEIIPA